MAQPVITAVSATASAVSVTVTAAAGSTHTRARLVGSDGTEEDEQQISGSGTITLTPDAAGHKEVIAWGSDAGGSPTSEPIVHPGGIDVPVSGTSLEYSIDGGTTWKTVPKFSMPVTVGYHTLSLGIAGATSEGIQLRITGEDAGGYRWRMLKVAGHRMAANL